MRSNDVDKDHDDAIGRKAYYVTIAELKITPSVQEAMEAEFERVTKEGGVTCFDSLLTSSS